MEELTCFEVETYHKDGNVTTEYITAESEEKMWDIYDELHNYKVLDCAIVDSWIA